MVFELVWNNVRERERLCLCLAKWCSLVQELFPNLPVIAWAITLYIWMALPSTRTHPKLKQNVPGKHNLI